jgi:hypothetical protein
MTNTLPLRLTILHLAQRFRIDGATFILFLLARYSSKQIAKKIIIYFQSFFVQTMTALKGPSG